MKDLTRGSIVGHILGMAPPIVASMITIMICQLVDLYFVASAGEAAVAGVAAAGNAGFLINGLMQVLAVMLNIALAPVLIAGWGTGHAFGVAGAGLASSIAVLIGALMLFAY